MHSHFLPCTRGTKRARVKRRDFIHKCIDVECRCRVSVCRKMAKREFQFDQRNRTSFNEKKERTKYNQLGTAIAKPEIRTKTHSQAHKWAQCRIHASEAFWNTNEARMMIKAFTHIRNLFQCALYKKEAWFHSLGYCRIDVCCAYIVVVVVRAFRVRMK